MVTSMCVMCVCVCVCVYACNQYVCYVCCVCVMFFVYLLSVIVCVFCNGMYNDGMLHTGTQCHICM